MKDVWKQEFFIKFRVAFSGKNVILGLATKTAGFCCLYAPVRNSFTKENLNVWGGMYYGFKSGCNYGF
jgi:hypothetical protein